MKWTEIPFAGALKLPFKIKSISSKMSTHSITSLILSIIPQIIYPANTKMLAAQMKAIRQIPNKKKKTKKYIFSKRIIEKNQSKIRWMNHPKIQKIFLKIFVKLSLHSLNHKKLTLLKGNPYVQPLTATNNSLKLKSIIINL